MRNALFWPITAIVVAGLTMTVRSQNSRSASENPDRTLGAAEVYYLKEKNKVRAQVRVYLSGKPEDIVANKDTLTMDVAFEMDGQKITQPKIVYIALSSYFREKSKFHGDHDLHLYTDGLEGMARTTWRTKVLTSNLRPTGGGQEIYLAAIQYEKFLSLVKAREAVVSLGESSFPLKKEHLKALQDLNATIEK